MVAVFEYESECGMSDSRWLLQVLILFQKVVVILGLNSKNALTSNGRMLRVAHYCGRAVER